MSDKDSFLGDTSEESVDIGLTPLIDVVFQLLVFFMVTSTFVSPSIFLQLPKISNSVSEDATGSLMVELDREGDLYFEGKSMTKEELVTSIESAQSDLEDVSVALRADQATPYQAVSEAMEAIGEAGVSKIQFIFDPKP